MRTVVHLSDLHFGRVDPALLTPLADTIHHLAPALVVVSGDLTQRARTAEFVAAKAFLGRLPVPQVVVPGNHDVPLHDVASRLFGPLDKFRRHIEPNLSPSFVDEQIAVLGVNTTRALVVKNGRINEAQLEFVRSWFSALPESLLKVVVTHHPFDVPVQGAGHERVGRAELALAVFARCGVDLLLAGHLHTSCSVVAHDGRKAPGHKALLVSAGTATSTRARGETNSFNLLRLQPQRAEVQRWEWRPDAGQFRPATIDVFERLAGGWVASPAEPQPGWPAVGTPA